MSKYFVVCWYKTLWQSWDKFYNRFIFFFFKILNKHLFNDKIPSQFSDLYIFFLGLWTLKKFRRGKNILGYFQWLGLLVLPIKPLSLTRYQPIKIGKVKKGGLFSPLRGPSVHVLWSQIGWSECIGSRCNPHEFVSYHGCWLREGFN